MNASDTPATDLFSDFLEHIEKERSMSAHTVTGYRHDIGSFVGFLNRNTPKPVTGSDLEAIHPRRVRSWLAERREDGADAAATLARALSALRAFYRWLDLAHGIENAKLLAMSGPKLKTRLR
ncbi:MAG TPA: recombinase XerC, partial [Hyphomonadaceae bacterium]|nr:recombinase XerC [Hyphomonadaceae bacterium]